MLVTSVLAALICVATPPATPTRVLVMDVAARGRLSIGGSTIFFAGNAVRVADEGLVTVNDTDITIAAGESCTSGIVVNGGTLLTTLVNMHDLPCAAVVVDDGAAVLDPQIGDPGLPSRFSNNDIDIVVKSLDFPDSADAVEAVGISAWSDDADVCGASVCVCDVAVAVVIDDGSECRALCAPALCP